MNPTQKIAEIYKRMRLDEAKKLDPVGKADADIDNDGDVDDSDDYLHNRRKAIKKSMKEEVCPECGKEPCECDDEDEDDMEEACKSKSKKEAVSIDPDDGEVSKMKDDSKKKKKSNNTDTETSNSSNVSEAAVQVDLKQPVDKHDHVAKGTADATAAGRAGPSTKYRTGDNTQGDRKPLKKFKEMRK